MRELPGIEVNQLTTIIRDVLWDATSKNITNYPLYSPEAIHQLLGTCCVESLLGRYLFQINGPAQGPFMVQPSTEIDLWRNEFPKHPGVIKFIHKLGVSAPGQYLSYLNLPYQIILARMIYYRVPEPIPPDLKGQSWYWKDYYNTKFGKGATQRYRKLYNTYILKRLK